MKKIIWIAVPLVIVFLGWSLFSGDDSAYLDQINEEIEERKDFLRNDAQSPFVLFEVPYQEPAYFPIEAKYRVNARVERLSSKSVIQLPDNKGQKQRYQRFAWLHFRLEGQPHKLMVLKPAGGFGGDFFFLAFSDETSGETSYGGGRYLDLEIGKSDKVVLDFNLAYSPYCAYVDEYSCPLPLRENRLNLPIEAGEKFIYDY